MYESRNENLSFQIKQNLQSKLQDFRSLPEEIDNKLRVIVYGDHESVSYQMWNSIFHDDINFRYSSNLGPIPIPPRYSPRIYEQYEREAKRFIADYVRDNGLHIIWDLYNVSTLAKCPRMHLLLANRRVKRSELERWAHVDRPGLGSLRSHGGGDSGAGSPLRRSTRSSSRGLRRTDSGDSSGAGSVVESIAGSSSAGGSSGNLSSDNSGVFYHPQFITIETLRSLVSTVLEDSQSSISAPQTSGSLSSEGTQTPRFRQSPRLLQRSAGLLFDSEAEPPVQSIEQPD